MTNGINSISSERRMSRCVIHNNFVSSCLYLPVVDHSPANLHIMVVISAVYFSILGFLCDFSGQKTVRNEENCIKCVVLI